MARSKVRTALARVGWAIALVTGIGCGLTSVLGLAGSVWWRFDLLAHFRVQYALALLGAALLAAVVRRFLAAGVFVALAALDVGLIAPFYVTSAAPVASGATPLRLTLFNLHHDNPRVAEVASYLGQNDADIVIALETTRAWVDGLTRARPGFHVTGEARDDAFGIAVLSRWAPSSTQVIRLAGSRLPAVEVLLEVAGKRVALLAVHPPPPVSKQLAGERDRIIAAAGAWASQKLAERARRVENAPDHVIVAGDLNATPWSLPLRRLAGDTPLINSLVGFGVQASWPRQLLPLRVPIDHVLHDRSLTTRHRRLGPFLGSDHRPVEITLQAAAGP